MIAIVDHGAADTGPLVRAFQRLGADAQPVNSIDRLERAARIVIGGLASFAALVRGLRDRRLVGPLVRAILEGRPFLGIGPGMHLLLDVSYEAGQHTGLGVLPGKAVTLEADAGHPVRRLYTPPHQGWAPVRWTAESPLLRGLTSGDSFYFEHAAVAQPLDTSATTAVSNYGVDFTAVVSSGRMFGTQFVPELSQEAGLRMLGNFAAL